ncbi:unnamed protein product [Rotaria sp. Silwood2]|nr:unnamed protein product [Rotaria sp. Silwood2]CAF2896288.1 unnamed protein product [Rotaria sp. Silwood2]CAF3293770.1 unnamed protein product [Rotaria sp. Silwood2]CAF4282358.1 unnamed protein product [Rotaria sp. Silwood2]CAF4414865.1 unnamed protein product [Rotaria sp. Silwood2]
MIEEQLQPNSANGSGALEHDETYLYCRDASLSSFNIINYLFRSSSTTDNNSSNAYYSSPAELNIPDPLPLDVAIIDASILLYGTMFVRVPNKHRLNMLQHFIDIIKQSKALKTLAETKQSSSIDDENVKNSACTVVMQTLSHQNPILRCAAGEALGRLTQVVDDGRFVADIVQICLDRLKDFCNVSSRTGYSLALGYQSASIVQVWALNALGLIADCSGQMLRSYIESCLALILYFLSISPSQSNVFQCCERLLDALIIKISPELQTNTNYALSIDKSSVEYQHAQWDALRNKINRLVSETNESSICSNIEELFKENIVRGSSLFARSVIQTQAALPGRTSVYAALVLVINLWMEAIGGLISRQVISSFHRTYHQNDKINCLATTKFISHLVNQNILHEIVVLEILVLLREN